MQTLESAPTTLSSALCNFLNQFCLPCDKNAADLSLLKYRNSNINAILRAVLFAHQFADFVASLCGQFLPHQSAGDKSLEYIEAFVLEAIETLHIVIAKI